MARYFRRARAAAPGGWRPGAPSPSRGQAREAALDWRARPTKRDLDTDSDSGPCARRYSSARPSFDLCSFYVRRASPLRILSAFLSARESFEAAEVRMNSELSPFEREACYLNPGKKEAARKEIVECRF